MYYTNKPAIPLLVAFTPLWCSIEPVYKLILDTNVNSTNCTPFIHYANYPPCWSASIPIARRLSAHGYFSPNVPGCFVLDHKEGFLKGDIVVKEVGLIPIGGVQITQLVAPLSSYLSVLLCFLMLIIMAFFPCFFWSSAIFGKIDRVSGRDEVQSQFSDSSSMA